MTLSNELYMLHVMDINLLIQQSASLNPDWFNGIKPLSEKMQKRCYIVIV